MLVQLLVVAGTFLFTAGAATLELGVNGHPLTQVNYLEVPIAQQIALVKELGAKWYRCDVSEYALQNRRERLDELVRLGNESGIQILFVLVPEGGARNSEITVKQIEERSEAFALRMVEAFRDSLHHWELGNELDLYAMIKKGELTISGDRWEGDGAHGDLPEHYEPTRMERACAEIRGLQRGVKSGDPKASTIVNAGGWLHYGFIEVITQESARVDFDILSWHWYSEMGSIQEPRPGLNLPVELKKFKKPLWITEINRRNGSLGDGEVAQAEYIKGAFTELEKTLFEKVMLYELLDEPQFGEGNPESHYGLIHMNQSNGKWTVGSEKPAFRSVKDRK